MRPATRRWCAIAALAAAVALLYAQPVASLAVEWASNPDASHGPILVAVALAVAWSRRRQLFSSADPGSPRDGIMPLVVFTAGLLTYLIGELAADVFLTRVSLLVVLAGAIWYVAGRRSLRSAAAPLVFVALALPLPAILVNTITLPLQLVASRIAAALLTAAHVPVFREGNVLTLPSGTLQVAEACSGLRSAISLGALGVLLAWASDAPAWRRVALVAMTVPIAIALNGVRIAAAGMAVEQWGSAAARGGWHTLTGWLTFVASLGVLLIVYRTFARGDMPERAEVRISRAPA